MARAVTHKPIVQFHKEVAAAHVGINGFYRFNMSEITGKFRSGVETPALLLESHSSALSGNGVANFNHRAISFLVMDFAGKITDYDKQEEVLNECENICLDIISLMIKYNSDKTHWLFGKFDVSKVQIEKVGPLWDNMYGWNVIYTLKNQEKMCFDESKWAFPPEQ